MSRRDAFRGDSRGGVVFKRAVQDVSGVPTPRTTLGQDR